MSWITKIQNKPQKDKIRLIWITASIVVVLMIILWIVAYKYNKNKNEKIFDSLDQQISNERKYYEDHGVAVPDKYKFFK